MKRPVGILLAVLLALPAPSVAQSGAAVVPDTRLVLKNGAEVRGRFLALKEGQYTIELADGRTMSYAADDVERMEPISQSGTGRQMPEVAPTRDPLPANCGVFISEGGLDMAFYTTIKEIKVSKKWYGSTSEMFDDLAAKARKVGADGVINVRTWHAPSGFSWAAPHAGGMAIRWTAAGRDALPGLDGRCY